MILTTRHRTQLKRWYVRLYRMYDRLMTRLNLPMYYCSQCERRIRHWVYRFEGVIYCQKCADFHVAEMQERSR